MRPATLAGVVVAALVLAVFGFIFLKSQSVDTEVHERHVQTIRQVQALEIALNQNILQVRQGIIFNYDGVAGTLRSIKKLAPLLNDVPEFVGAIGEAELAAGRRAYAEILARKVMLVEQFKSENAILHNSLRYFPIATADLADIVVASDPLLANQLRNLLQEVLMYNLYGQAAVVPAIRTKIESLSASKKQYSKFASPRSMELILQHAESILGHKSKLDRVVAEIIGIDSHAVLDSLYVTYKRHYRDAMEASNAYRLSLYLVAILLSALVYYAYLRLRNTMDALNATNEHLEQRVRSRTAELELANNRLTDQKLELSRYVSQLHETHTELRRIAVTDQLTGLYTRRFLFSWMEKQISMVGRGAEPFCGLLLDVDFFKRINDEFGHAEGDAVLCQFAEVVRASVRKSDVVGRIGGEEFLVLLPGTELERALEVAEKLRVAIEQALTRPIPITVSIGASSCAAKLDTSDPDKVRKVISAFLDQADRALYLAKNSGRNNCKSYDALSSPEYSRHLAALN